MQSSNQNQSTPVIAETESITSKYGGIFLNEPNCKMLSIEFRSTRQLFEIVAHK